MVFVPSTLSAIDTLRGLSLFQVHYQQQIHWDYGLCSKHTISNKYWDDDLCSKHTISNRYTKTMIFALSTLSAINTEMMVFVPSTLSATDTPRLWSLFQAHYQQQIHWDDGPCSKYTISNRYTYNGPCSKHTISSRYIKTMVFVPSTLSATDTLRFQAHYQQ